MLTLASGAASASNKEGRLESSQGLDVDVVAKVCSKLVAEQLAMTEDRFSRRLKGQEDEHNAKFKEQEDRYEARFKELEERYDARCEEQEHAKSSPSESLPPSGKRRRVDSAADGDERPPMLDGSNKRFLSELEKVEARITHAFAQQLEQLKNEIFDTVEERVSDGVDKATKDAIDDCRYYVDDTLTGIKVEMEKFVKEEMVNVQERVVESLESVSWEGSLRRLDD